MKCVKCRRRAVMKSEKTGKVFCEDHGFDFMIKTGEEFMPRIDVKK